MNASSGQSWIAPILRRNGKIEQIWQFVNYEKSAKTDYQSAFLCYLSMDEKGSF